jgi:multimeric flavodoxin WrbA
MSRKVLILNGSPRVKGNTAVLSQRLAAGVRESGSEAEIIYLHGLDIQACDACEGCQTGGKGCVIGDDMQEIYPKLRDSDAIVIASPVYWYSMTAQMKLCLDRWYALESVQDIELKWKR